MCLSQKRGMREAKLKLRVPSAHSLSPLLGAGHLLLPGSFAGLLL